MNLAQHPLLSRSPARPGPHVTFLHGAPEMSMMCGRLHEACGMARRTLALWVAAQMQGPVLWISPAWAPDALHTDGMTDWVEPGRFLFVRAVRAEDVLWSMEEALRSGAVPLVVADVPGLPSLTAVRRMHLAAEAGGAAIGRPPLGLLLTPDQGGAQGVESRWQLQPDHGVAPLGQWRLSRLRARTAPQATWRVSRLPHRSQDARDALAIKAA